MTLRLLRCWSLVLGAEHLIFRRPLTLRETWHAWRAAWEVTGG